MKKNLIGAIAGWKSAALLALVAMVAAVAFSGVLSTTQNADAVTNAEDSEGGDVATIAPGGTFVLDTDNIGSGYTVLKILDTSIGKASFVSNGGQSVVCKDKTSAADPSPCDTDPNSGAVKVSVKVADDSPDGPIVLTSQAFGTTTVEQEIVSVESGLTPTTITVGPTTPTETAIAVDTDPTTAGNQAGSVGLTVTIKNAAGANLTNAQSVLLTTSQGLLDCGGGVSNVQQCLVTITGTATATLSTAGVSGKATVTAAIAAHSLSSSTDITFYGTATKISVASDQGAIEIGGSTFVVVSLTDDAGNAVAGRKFSGATDATSAGPAPGDTTLVLSHTAPKPSQPADIPTCFENVNTNAVDGGTNASGQCVIKVFAPKKDTDPDGEEDTNVSGSNPATAAAKDATRGEHTVTVALSATTKASVTINVGGPPETITSDAPASVEALSETKITVTVLDDADVRVGGVAIRIDQVEGDGLITNGGTSLDTDPDTAGAQPTMTVDGQHSFTYLAPRGGTAVFRVQAGSGAAAKVDLIEVAIGEAAMDDMEMATWNQPLASGTLNLVWNGEDGADPSAGAGSGVTAIWQWNGSSWDGYFPSAADVPGGNTLTSLTNGDAYWVIVE